MRHLVVGNTATANGYRSNEFVPMEKELTIVGRHIQKFFQCTSRIVGSPFFIFRRRRRLVCTLLVKTMWINRLSGPRMNILMHGGESGRGVYRQLEGLCNRTHPRRAPPNTPTSGSIIRWVGSGWSRRGMVSWLLFSFMTTTASLSLKHTVNRPEHPRICTITSRTGVVGTCIKVQHPIVVSNGIHSVFVRMNSSTVTQQPMVRFLRKGLRLANQNGREKVRM